LRGSSTPFPNALFMREVARTLTAADDGSMVGHRVLICDRDAKWSAPEIKGVMRIRRRPRLGGLLNHYYRAA
jgi:hypothetical protein